jgi:hypothetical protein
VEERMEKLWVVECQYDRKWGICNFTTYQFAFTNYYNAHRVKREIQKHLHEVGSKLWTKKRFRVREYIQK